VEEGGKPEDCVASLHWLPFAGRGEYEFFCVNISPTTEHYGQVFCASANDGCGGELFSNSMEEFIEKTAKYFTLLDKTAISQEDLVEVYFGDDDDDGAEDAEEDENEDGEEDDL
jgi:hypothetical protein